MKKLAIASAIALMGLGSAHAVEIITPQPQVAGVFSATTPFIDGLGGTALTDVTALMGKFTTSTTTNIADPGITTTGPEIGVLSGAVNLARINGAIDISGTNVALASLANNVTATATATATTSTADAYAIAGAKLSTTVIGAMNSATVEVMGKVTEQSNSFGQKTGLGSLALQDGTATVSTTDIGRAAGAVAANLGNDLTSAKLLDTTGASAQLNLGNLTSDITSSTTTKVSELQNINVFNTAINLGALDAGIKVAANVDPNAWFLNPQTGVVNLSNVAMATTAIGAMNSGVTRLGANLSTPTVTVK